MLFVLLVFLLSDTIRLNRRCLFKITGYIHSIYRVGWDTILARWSLDIDSIYSRFTLVLPSLLPRCSLGLSLTLASHWLWLSVHRRLTVGISPLCSWSYTYTKKRTDWYAMSGSICHRFLRCRCQRFGFYVRNEGRLLYAQNVLYGVDSAGRIKGEELVVQNHPIFTLRTTHTFDVREQTNRHKYLAPVCQIHSHLAAFLAKSEFANSQIGVF